MEVSHCYTCVACAACDERMRSISDRHMHDIETEEELIRSFENENFDTISCLTFHADRLFGISEGWSLLTSDDLLTFSIDLSSPSPVARI